MIGSRRGLTLPELMITSAILMAFMLMCGDIVVNAYHQQVFMSNKHSAMRQASVSMNLLARELRLCSKLVKPTLGMWGFNTPYDPSFANGGFQFVRNSAIGEVVVVYWHDNGELRRTLAMWNNGAFDPNSPGSWALVPGETLQGRLMAYNVKQMRVVHRTDVSPKTVQAQLWLDTVADKSATLQPLTIEAQVLAN